MPPRDWAFRIQDIFDAIAKIQRYVSDVDFETFENDEETMDAVIHNLTVIGEAANHIPADIAARHPLIPWRQMVDLRNFSVHAYWNLRPAVIWDTIQNDLPPPSSPSANSCPSPKNDRLHQQDLLRQTRRMCEIAPDSRKTLRSRGYQDMDRRQIADPGDSQRPIFQAWSQRRLEMPGNHDGAFKTGSVPYFIFPGSSAI